MQRQKISNLCGEKIFIVYFIYHYFLPTRSSRSAKDHRRTWIYRAGGGPAPPAHLLLNWRSSHTHPHLVTSQYIHRKKKVREFPVLSRDVTNKLFLGGNNDVITELFLHMGSLVSGIPAGDGKILNLFFRCSLSPPPTYTTLYLHTRL